MNELLKQRTIDVLRSLTEDCERCNGCGLVRMIWNPNEQVDCPDCGEATSLIAEIESLHQPETT